MCRVVLNFNCAITDVNLPRKNLVWTAIIFAFLGWIVSIGSLATLQEACIKEAGNAGDYTGVRGFSATILSCAKVYRYYWFIDGFQIVILLAAAAIHSAGAFRKYRNSLIGLFIIATLLYIETTDAFLTGKQRPRYSADELEDRANTKIAGVIITSVANFFFLLVAGYDDESAKTL